MSKSLGGIVVADDNAVLLNVPSETLEESGYSFCLNFRFWVRHTMIGQGSGWPA